MRLRIVVSGLLTVCVLALPACSSSENAVLQHVTSSRASSVLIRVLVASGSHRARAGRRFPAFLSAATAGVTLSLTGATTLSASFAIGPGAAICGGATGSPRTCSVSIAVAPGTYTLTGTAFDAAPVGGIIPNTAHELATGAASGVTITAGQANTASLYLGGVVAAYGAPTFLSVPADAAVHTVGIAIVPTDFDNEPIVAGGNDPYANPISLTLTESGGNGHESLIKNGMNVGSATTLTKSTDAVQLQYDGGGSAGYTGSIAIAANGVASTTFNVSPMYLAGPSGHANGNTVVFNAVNETSTVAVTETSAPNNVMYSGATSGCNGIAIAGGVSGGGASASVAFDSGSTASTSGCTIGVTDSLGTTVTKFTVTNSTFAPTSIANDVLWLDANDGTTISQTGGSISQWNDKSGQTNNVTQTVAADKPTYVPGAINGLAAANFNGSTDYFINTAPSGQTGATAYSMCMVFSNSNPTGTAYNETLGGGSSSELDFQFGAASTPTDMGVNVGSNGYAYTNFVIIANSAALFSEYADSANASQAFANGTPGTLHSGSFSMSPFSQFHVGVDRTAAAHRYPGYIGEILLYRRSLTTAERQKLEGYLAWKWGLASQLPTAHPYKSAPP